MQKHQAKPHQVGSVSAGVGDAAFFDNKHRNREDARLLRRAVLNRWDIKPELRKLTLERIEDMLNGSDPSHWAAAAKLVKDINGQNIAIDTEEDKTERLDAGASTENVHHAVIVKGIDPDKL